jgi:26S proteasome regulatory subunit T1
MKELGGIKESDTGMCASSMWDLVSDKQMMQEEQPLQVARCTKIINAGQEDAKYMINVKQIAKFVVGLGEKVAPTDIEESMRVGVDRTKYQIQLPLPPRIDPSVTMMTVEEKPDVTYDDVRVVGNEGEGGGGLWLPLSMEYKGGDVCLICLRGGANV